jgi:histidinol dehydrogenase
MGEWMRFIKFAKSRSSVAVRDRTLESYIAQLRIMQKKYDLGYASLAEFAKEAMRKRFEEIKAFHRRTSLSDF